jgi:hypothetical protein
LIPRDRHTRNQKPYPPERPVFQPIPASTSCRVDARLTYGANTIDRIVAANLFGRAFV